MYLSTYLCTNLPTSSPMFLLMYQCSHLCTYLPTSVPIYLPLYLSTYLCTNVPIYLPLHQCTNLPTSAPMYTSVPMFSSPYQCTYLSVQRYSFVSIHNDEKKFFLSKLISQLSFLSYYSSFIYSHEISFLYFMRSSIRTICNLISIYHSGYKARCVTRLDNFWKFLLTNLLDVVTKKDWLLLGLFWKQQVM